MKTSELTIDDYINKIPDERKEIFKNIIHIIKTNIPKGFVETIQYSMPTWVIPLKAYPNGYHCAANTPLPFLSIANQKNFIAIYHMGIYAEPKLLEWFVSEFPKYSKKKLDMGKSCIRFKKPEDIPLNLIAELCKKMTPKEWIKLYETNFKK